MSLQSLLKTSKRYLDLLALEGIHTPKDFLEFFPRTHEDRARILPLSQLDLHNNETQSSKVHIIDKNVLPRGSKKLYQITFEDADGTVGYAVYFNSYFPFKNVSIDERYIIVGKPKFQYGKLQFTHPEFIHTQAETATVSQTHEAKVGRLYPIYPEVQGISSDRFAKNTWKLLPKIDTYFDEYLPEEFLQTFHLLDVNTTIKYMHYPPSKEAHQDAQRRVFFDRLLRIQLYNLIQKKEYQKKNPDTPSRVTAPQWKYVKTFIDTLPFSLTKAQKRVIKEAIEDVHHKPTMMRLLQGDVGSGKTVVSATIAWYCLECLHQQVVVLAPLSVLAQQHLKTFAKLFLPLGKRVEFLTGSQTTSQKAQVKKKLAQGAVDILVGTHAVLQEDVVFDNLGLAIIDEQHKFGVKQRARLRQQGSPHILQMSATPIPRSLALAYFGEFDVSVIDELPAGRKSITTKIITTSEIKRLQDRILQKCHQGQKMFVVTPLIEESEYMETTADATQTHQDIQHLLCGNNEETTSTGTTKLPFAQVGLLHGAMKATQKNEIMKDFADGKIKVLVATTVIEVGVDIPEATMMLIRNAERFGLSQLHQLRGRIGRNNLHSYCFLETKQKSGETYKRLKTMETINDGFELAKIDLTYRGSGEILGTKQSGLSDLPLEILTDVSFIETVKRSALWLLEKYPDLQGLPGLQKFISDHYANVIA